MKMSLIYRIVGVAAAIGLSAQEPGLLDSTGIRQGMATEKEKLPQMDSTPKAVEGNKVESPELALIREDRQRAAKEIAALKAKDGGPRRFGDDLFDSREEMISVAEGGISEEYVLGVGDQIQVAAFGSATFEIPTTINGRGEVVIPKVGTVKVGGMSLGRAKAAIQSKVNQQLASTTIDVTVLKLRQIRVFVLGEVYKPGSYLVPSLSSVVNILSLAGGPTSLGTYRQIKVMRGGKAMQVLDLYPLRAEGQGNLNIALQSGDTIFVPLIQNPVLLEGSFVRIAVRDAGLDANADRVLEEKIKKPAVSDKTTQEPNHEPPTPSMQFELLPGENARDALHFAGGLLHNAYADSLTLRRQDRSGVTAVTDLAIEKLETYELFRGDILSAFPRRDRLESVVSVAGWVRVPGTFARTEGLKVGDLLKNQGQIMPDTYLQRGEIIRTFADGSTRFLSFNVSKAMQGCSEDNLQLENRDKVQLTRVTRMRLPKQVTFSGPFTQAGVYEFHEGMRVADLVFKAGIPEKRANGMIAELARRRADGPSEVRKLDLAKLVSTENSSPTTLLDEALNPLLREDDQISVYEKPEFRIHRIIHISGQVTNPGQYVLDSDRTTLSQIIKRAGGLTSEGMLSAGILLRNPLGGGATQSSGHVADVSGITEILERLNETKIYDTKMELKTGLSPSPSLFKIPVLHGLASGKLNRVVVNFPAALAGDVDSDLELYDQDEIVIPRRTETVMILGETATPFAFYKARPGMTVSDLVKLAGGTTRNADSYNIRLLKADGRLYDSWVSGRKVEPGDAVLVPQRVQRATNWQDSLAALTPLAIMINAVRR